MKRQYPCSGKKKDSMTRSIANQEAIERFIKKVSNAYEKTTNMMLRYSRAPYPFAWSHDTKHVTSIQPGTVSQQSMPQSLG